MSPFNGPGRELQSTNGEFLEEAVYCTECGSIFVHAAPERSCPACTLAEMLGSIGDRVEQLNRDIDVVDR